MSDFIPKALEECPGWVEWGPGRMAHVASYQYERENLVGTDLAPAIAAAQRYEWKAKRLAELEAEDQHRATTAHYRPLIPPPPMPEPLVVNGITIVECAIDLAGNRSIFLGVVKPHAKQTAALLAYLPAALEWQRGAP